MTPTGKTNLNPDVERLEALLGGCLEAGEAHLEELVERLCEVHSDRAAAIREEVETARSAGLRRKPSEDADRVPSGGTTFERIGPYQPLRELGRGGQGFVYLAEDTRLHRVVALKVLKGFGALSDKVMQRFRREAEVASRLDHPGICGVYDAGVTAGIPYIAMRLVEGQTLADSIKLARTSLTPEPSAGELIEFDDGAAPEPARVSESSPASTTRKRSEILKIVGIVEKAARALHAAHEAGIIHRDIKPGNIMVTPAGEPVILDFGLASEEANELSLTQTGDLFGTPAYMSPEQLLAHRVQLDRRTDVYSLGVTLYECVTLQRPFDAATREAMYRAIQYKDPSHARKLNREVPVDLDVVLEKALEKDCDRRYATALDFAEDLRRVRELEPISARRVSVAGRVARWARRRPAPAALAAILVIGIPAVTALSGYSLAKAEEIRRGKELALLAEVDRHLEKGYAELAQGEPKVAVAAFESALALKPDSGEAIAGTALALQKTGDHAASLRFLEGHQGFEGADFAITRLRYEALTSLGREPEGAEVTKRAPREARTPLGWFLGGTIEMKGLDEQADKKAARRAVRYFTHAALMTPRARALYHQSLAQATHYLGEVEPSRQAYEALFELWPDSPIAAFFAGNAVSDFDAPAAMAAFKKAIELKPDLAEAHTNLGSAYRAEGDVDAAIACFQKAIEIRPGLSQPYCNLGHVLVRIGRPDEAISWLRKLIERNPSVAEPYYNLAVALKAKGAIDEAIAAYQKAIALNPTDVDAICGLGAILCDAKSEFDAAIVLFKKAIALRPDDTHAYRNIGVANRKKGDLVAGAVAWRKVTELQPDNAEAWQELGWALGHLDVDKATLDEAITVWRRLTELKPDFAEAHCNLANYYAKQGRLLLALGSFRRGHELGSAAPGWTYPSAEWVLQFERAVLEEAERLASTGLDANDPEGRGKAAATIEGLLVGWRQDVDRGLRLETVGTSLGSLVREDPWNTLRDPTHREKFPEVERKRWQEIFSAVDELVRRIEGGK